MSDYIQPAHETLELEEVADGMYCFPDRYKPLKEDFFKGLRPQVGVGGAATGVARAREVAPLDVSDTTQPPR